MVKIVIFYKVRMTCQSVVTTGNFITLNKVITSWSSRHPGSVQILQEFGKFYYKFLDYVDSLRSLDQACGERRLELWKCKSPKCRIRS